MGLKIVQFYRDRGVGGGGGGGARVPQYFLNFKELVRKSVRCAPQYWVTNVPPAPFPNFKIASWSLNYELFFQLF